MALAYVCTYWGTKVHSIPNLPTHIGLGVPQGDMGTIHY